MLMQSKYIFYLLIKSDTAFSPEWKTGRDLEPFVLAAPTLKNPRVEGNKLRSDRIEFNLLPRYEDTNPSYNLIVIAIGDSEDWREAQIFRACAQDRKVLRDWVWTGSTKFERSSIYMDFDDGVIMVEGEK
jgi:hypothetical protein